MRGSDGASNRPTMPRRGRWSAAEQARLKALFGLRDDAVIARELNRPVSSVRRMAEKLFPLRKKSGPWTADEVNRLKHYLGATTEEVIARVLGRSVDEVHIQITELGRIRRNGTWTRGEIARLKRIYGTRSDEDLARIFGRREDEIRRLAKEHALAKDKAFTRKVKGEASTRMPRWSQDELAFLRRHYSTWANLDIAKRLNRSVKSIVSKAHNLGLKKSSERLRSMGRENVSLRYRK